MMETMYNDELPESDTDSNDNYNNINMEMNTNMNMDNNNNIKNSITLDEANEYFYNLQGLEHL